MLADLHVTHRSAAAGVIASFALLAIYIGLITLAQGLDHALQQFMTDALFIVPVALGFGVQMGLFAELHRVTMLTRGSAAVTAGATGTSAAAMLACCAHHLVDLLPIVGLSAAAVLLNEYRLALFAVGITMNAIGIVVIARQLARARRASRYAVRLAAAQSLHSESQAGLTSA